MILLIEDEDKIRNLTAAHLQEEGFAVTAVSHAEEGKAAMRNQRITLVVADVMLPGLNGLDFCRWLRTAGYKIPVILLTALDQVPDRIAGLEAGADDYLPKPFAMEELTARIHALFRKVQGYPRGTITRHGVSLDPDEKTATREGKVIPLSEKEAKLLYLLMLNSGRIVSRSLILEEVWDQSSDLMSNVMDVILNHLRKKLDEDFPEKLLATVKGQGLRFGTMEQQ